MVKIDPDIFLGKILVYTNLGNKGQKMDFFLLFLKIQSLVFPIFCMRLEDYKQ